MMVHRFTSEDVKASYERIRFPPEGVFSQRKALFKISSIETPDDYTVVFKLNSPRRFYDGWICITF